MRIFRKNKSNYLKQIVINTSFTEAKRMYLNNEISKQEYTSLLKSFLEEFETINDSETTEALQMLISN